MKEKYIVYQAYGNKDILNEALYSILSFYKVHGLNQQEISIIVYTDTPSHFESVLGNGLVVYHSLNPSIIKEWRGAIDFVHRVKIKTLIDFTTPLQNSAVLYLDSDIYFLKPVNELFRQIAHGTFMMHEFEGRLNDSPFPLILKMGKFIRRHADQLSAQGLEVPLDSPVFNAGVIGFNTSKKLLLNKVLCFTDIFYTHYPKHIAEQFGFSFYLSKEGNVYSTCEYFFHYWRFKEFRTILKDFFHHHHSSGIENIIAELDKVSPVTLGESKKEYDTLHWLPKAFRKLRKNRWKMPDYKYWEK